MIAFPNFMQLINRQHPLKQDWIPENLVLAPYTTEPVYMEKETVKALKELIEKIHGQQEIMVLSGYRSFQEQTKLYQQSLQEHGEIYTRRYVAEPGCSEHQSGLAVDLGLVGSTYDVVCSDFSGRPVTERFLNEMMNYGFILRYPEGRSGITGISYEPWHFRYVGLPHSQIMSQQKWVLEEYHKFLAQWGDCCGS